jgi:hypothetical protein
MGYVDRTTHGGLGPGAGVAGISGYALSRAVGPAGWIPAAVGFGAYALLTKFVRKNIAVRAALALLIAQTVWFAIGALADPAHAGSVLPDIVLNVLLGALLFLWPGYITAGLTIFVHGAALLLVFSQFDGGSLDMERAMLAHFILRLGIILAAGVVIILRIHPDLDPEEEELEATEME